MEEEIQQYLRFHPLSSRSELMEGVNTKVSVATFKRLLAAMISAGSIEVIGQGPATCYKLTPQTFVTSYFDLESYFRKEVDEREIQQAFNFSLIPDILPNVDPFTMDERKHLTALQETFRRNVLEMTDGEYRKEMERLGVDLSWKSSQIEGNTYNLLETERLLLEKEEAKETAEDVYEEETTEAETETVEAAEEEADAEISEDAEEEEIPESGEETEEIA